MENWKRFADVYDPLKAGSIDGTDTEPHDHAVFRAMGAKYNPPSDLVSSPAHTVFVGRVAPSVSEEELKQLFKSFGRIRSFRLVRDIITGYPRGYAFVEYEDISGAKRAFRDGNRQILDGKEIVVEFEASRNMPGWIPRRLGGGFGGRKESGQLRFGGRDRPFRKPITLQVQDLERRELRQSNHERAGIYCGDGGRIPGNEATEKAGSRYRDRRRSRSMEKYSDGPKKRTTNVYQTDAKRDNYPDKSSHNRSKDRRSTSRSRDRRERSKTEEREAGRFCSRSPKKRERRRSRSGSSRKSERGRSGSWSPKRREWNPKEQKCGRSRPHTPKERRKSRSRTPKDRRKSRSPSQEERRKSVSRTPKERRKSRSPSRKERRKAHSPRRKERIKSRSRTPKERRKSYSRTPRERRKSRSRTPRERRKSRSHIPEERRKSRSRSPKERKKSRSRTRKEPSKSRSRTPEKRKKFRSRS